LWPDDTVQETTSQWWWKYAQPWRKWESLVERILRQISMELSLEALAKNPIPIPVGTGPGPQPNSIVGALVSAVSVKDAARRMQDEQRGTQLIERYDRYIDEVIDFVCGNVPPRPPIPWPPAGVLRAIEELTMFANSLPEGSMREELLGVAGRMMDRAVSETGMG
jgi:hypothetical protein